MKKYNVGQIITIKRDITTTGMFGSKKDIKAGTKGYVGVDKDIPMIHFLNGFCMLFNNKDKDIEIEGYSVEGISDWIYKFLSFNLPLDDFLEGYDITKEEFKEHIADALEELGMYDNTGNRS